MGLQYRTVEEERLAELRVGLRGPIEESSRLRALRGEEFGQELGKLRTLVEGDLKTLEKALDLAGAPWTPGRLPEWKEK